MPVLRLFKVGRSVVVTIPPAMRAELRVLCGDAVQLEVHDGALTMRPLEVRTVPVAPQAATGQHLRRAVRAGDE
jgi:antitoxin component of MazEF toxin-antitoxin module